MMKTHTGVALAFVGLLFVGVIAGLGGATTTAAEAPTNTTTPVEGFTIDLADSGDATATITLTFRLNSSAEQRAFNAVASNQSEKANLKTTLTQQFQALAAAGQNQTGREMSVQNPQIEATTAANDTVGVIRYSIDWTNLAASEAGGQRLIVAEPFASEGMPMDTVIVRGPNGYKRAEVTPAPTQDHPDIHTDASDVVWTDALSASNFTVSFARPEQSSTSTPPETTQDTDTSQNTTEPVMGPTGTDSSGIPLELVGVALILLGGGYLAYRSLSK